jgi:short-subunit dehydrogenase
MAADFAGRSGAAVIFGASGGLGAVIADELATRGSRHGAETRRRRRLRRLTAQEFSTGRAPS